MTKKINYRKGVEFAAHSKELLVHLQKHLLFVFRKNPLYLEYIMSKDQIELCKNENKLKNSSSGRLGIVLIKGEVQDFLLNN